jgi:hypothetical protein
MRMPWMKSCGYFTLLFLPPRCLRPWCHVRSFQFLSDSPQLSLESSAALCMRVFHQNVQSSIQIVLTKSDCQVLPETDWTQPVAELKPIRDSLYSAFGVERVV